MRIRKSLKNFAFGLVGLFVLSMLIMSLSLNNISDGNGVSIPGHVVMKNTRKKLPPRDEARKEADANARQVGTDRHGNGIAKMAFRIENKVITNKHESRKSILRENPIRKKSHGGAEGNRSLDAVQNITPSAKMKMKLVQDQNDTDMPPVVPQIVPPPPEEQLSTYQGRSPCLDESDGKNNFGFRFVYGKLRPILGVSRGDPEVRKANLSKWSAKMEKHFQSGKLEDLCRYKMTFSELREGEEHCPCSSPEMEGDVEIDWSPPSWLNMSLALSLGGIRKGGKRQPKNCVPRQRVAIIVPYKNRINQLHIFLNHLHRILLKQNMEYRVFVVEQAHPNIFNKASMMNIGFLEAEKLFRFDCVIFHDVDLLLENDRSLYACMKIVRHIAAYVDKHKYRLPYTTLIGGSVGFTPATFRKINGYSNTYWGWGGEDDDLHNRIKVRKIGIVHRLEPELSRFTMIDHERGVNFPVNVLKNIRLRRLKPVYTNFSYEGLSTVEYKVKSVVEEPLFTWIFAEMKSPLSEFFYTDGLCWDEQKAFFVSQADILDCATECQTKKLCHSFQLAYNITNFKPTCSLFLSACERTYISPQFLSFVYTKGRTFDTVT